MFDGVDCGEHRSVLRASLVQYSTVQQEEERTESRRPASAPCPLSPILPNNDPPDTVLSNPGIVDDVIGGGGDLGLAPAVFESTGLVGNDG